MKDGTYDRAASLAWHRARWSRRYPKITLCVGLAMVALVGCGDDSTATPTSTPGPTTPTAGPTVTIGVRDYAFDGVPARIAAGTPIAITNTSATEAHELTAFRLPDGEARSLAELQALPPDQLGALFPGAPALALVAKPGADGELVLGDGSLDEPGRYLLVCFIPMGAKPDEVVAALQQAAADPAAGPPQIAGGPPHLTAGMIAEIEVVP